MECLHCHREMPLRARNLCQTCYQKPEVRKHYHLAHRESNWYGNENDFNGPGAECAPTTAQPGTPEKLAVFEQRAEARQRLFHPDDPVVPHQLLVGSGREREYHLNLLIRGKEMKFKDEQGRG